MPPKRWAKPNQRPAANGGSGVATGVGANTAALLQYICGEIRDNNCLGLPEEELTGMATELMNAKTRAEVADWVKTLMLSDAFSSEVIRRREETGPAFEGETVKNPPVSTANAPAPSGGTLDLTKRSNAGGKRNKRGVNINQLPKANTATEALKPGHFECGCFATVHNLRGSCANCGRIICEQEADDVCYACGLDPSRCIAFEIAVQEGKLSEAAQQSNRDDYERAVERRDRLLEYAQNRSKRTTVIDDQSATLFSPQSAWMSPEERRAAEKSAAETERRRNIELMHRQRGAYQLHMEFVAQNLPLGSRKENACCGDVTAEPAEATAAAAAAPGDEANGEVDGAAVVATGAEPLPSLLQKIWYSPDGALVEAASKPKKGKGSGGGDDRSHPDANLPAQEGASMPLTSRPTQRRFDEVSKRVQQDYFEDDVEVFDEVSGEAQRAQLIFAPQTLLEDDEEQGDSLAGDEATASPPVVKPPSLERSARFAVTAVMRSNDDGVCLSMHQPWASLLVAGIKRHEGRVWGTNYRGRLWIHAASAQPVNVEEVEGHYSQFMAPGQVFPRHYPTKVLIGYVYVTDCMDRETYEATFQPEERQEESPFSFICVEPKALLFPLPMTGNHKLFTLDHRVHVAAKKQLGEID
jgi:activating signal cointegrator 1